MSFVYALVIPCAGSFFLSFYDARAYIYLRFWVLAAANAEDFTFVVCCLFYVSAQQEKKKLEFYESL